MQNVIPLQVQLHASNALAASTTKLNDAQASSDEEKSFRRCFVLDSISAVVCPGACQFEGLDNHRHGDPGEQRTRRRTAMADEDSHRSCPGHRAHARMAGQCQPMAALRRFSEGPL